MEQCTIDLVGVHQFGSVEVVADHRTGQLIDQPARGRGLLVDRVIIKIAVVLDRQFFLPYNVIGIINAIFNCCCAECLCVK